jgi:hypothetical protein
VNSTPADQRRNVWRHVVAVLLGSVSLVVIYFPELYWPQHWLLVHGSLIVLALWGVWLEWKDGALSVEIHAIPAFLRQHKLRRWRWTQPVPVAAWVLFFVATLNLPLHVP